MKNSHIPEAIIICLLALIVRPAGIPTVGAIAPDPTVRIEPAESVVKLNETFAVQVVIEEADDLAAFQFDLIYHPSILQVTEATLGDFLGSTGRSVVPIGPTVDNEQGRVSLGAVSFGEATGPSGMGVLASITCVAQGEDSSPLRLLNVQVLDSQGQAQSVTVENGQVEVRGAATATPVATATPSATLRASPAPAPTATPRPTSTPPRVNTPTPAAAAPPSPTPTATGTAVAETPTKAPSPSPTPSPTSPTDETPTRVPPPSPTLSPSVAATEIRPTETPTPTAKATETPLPVTQTPTSPSSTLPSSPSPTSTPSATLMPSPTPTATLVTPTAKGPWNWIVLVGLLTGLGLIILGILVLRMKRETANVKREM